MYLKYNKLETCQSDLDLIFTAMAQEKACFQSGYLLNKRTGKEEFVLSEEDLSAEDFPIFGYVNGKLNKDSGFTTAWDIPRQDINGMWIIKKPEQFQSLELNYDSESETVEFPQVDDI